MPGLDGLRAIAVVGVIFSHLVQMRVVPSTHIWRMIGYRGAFGVQIFFVLSGFLITWLLLKEESKSGRVNFSRFYIRRSVRILPPAFVFLGCMIVLGLLGAFPVSIQEMLASVFFYRNYTNGGISTGHFWSLSVEEQFYLFWPILLVVIRKSWRIPLTTIVLLAAPLSRIIYLTFFDDIDDSLLTQFEYCYDMLLAGCLLSLLRHDARWKHRMRSGFLQSWKGLLIAFVFLGVGVGPMVPDHLAGILQLAGSLGVALLINFVVEGHRSESGSDCLSPDMQPVCVQSK